MVAIGREREQRVEHKTIVLMAAVTIAVRHDEDLKQGWSLNEE